MFVNPRFPPASALGCIRVSFHVGMGVRFLIEVTRGVFVLGGGVPDFETNPYGGKEKTSTKPVLRHPKPS